ncbi:MAG: pyridoxamine 5'-phosphate oxidase family protein [Acidobacteria bacterium]|nr:pyridoxamine 5'-phosphate oxidase family protein [Acidobacteriota bacterium]
MAKFLERIDDKIRRFIGEQKMFFTASAPLAAAGRVNLSPKGIDTFRVLDDRTVCYLDLTGSGNETAAHLAENGRLTVMFCSFAGAPLILRLYGRGAVVHRNSPKWPELAALFDDFPGIRQIIVLHVESLQTSCGYAVPVYEFKEDRDQLIEWAAKKGADGIEEYRREKNRTSIDGLPTGLSD